MRLFVCSFAFIVLCFIVCLFFELPMCSVVGLMCSSLVVLFACLFVCLSGAVACLFVCDFFFCFL